MTIRVCYVINDFLLNIVVGISSILTQNKYPYFKKILEKYYPDTYIYDVTITKFFYWADFYPPEKLLEKYHEVYLFFDAQELEHKEEVIELMGPGVKDELLYTSNNTGDKVFRLLRESE